jgi:quercetin dioxygenase-like cupin family protein
MRRPFGKIRNQIQGTSMPEAFVVTPATRPAQLNVVGEQITVLASGSQTGGYEIFRQAGPEGSGPPLHCHPWDESFYVMRGNIAFGVGDKDMIAEPGTWCIFQPARCIGPIREGWRRDDFDDLA